MVLQVYLVTFHFSILTFGILTFSLSALYYQYPFKRVAKTGLILVAFALYFNFIQYQANQLGKHYPEAISYIQPIPDSISLNGKLLSFRGYNNGKRYQAYYHLKSKSEYDFFKQLVSPVELSLEASLELPEEEGNFQGFNYRSYLKSQGIYQIAQIKQIKQIDPVQNVSPIGILQTWRRQLIVFIQEQFPNPMKHYMTGLLLGYLDKDFDQMSDIYSQLGIIHLFALSGMQVNFFIKRFRYGLLRIGFTQESVNLLQIPFSFLYASLTGFSISVNRSLLQALFRQADIKNLDNVALSLLSLFTIMPQSLMTTGGILSFAYAFLLSILSFDHLKPIKASLYQTLILSVGILPILIWYFASFQPLSLLLTILLSLVFDCLMLPVLSLVFLLSPIIVIKQINPIFHVLESFLERLANWTGQGWVFGNPNALSLLVIILALGLLADRIRLKQRIWPLLLASLTCFFLVKHPLENEVTIVNVGQGDSIFIRDMVGKTILIDVGGKVTFKTKEDWQKGHFDSNAQRTLIPYLKSRGISHIDHLVLTHTDMDHIGDLEVVAKQFNIGQILVSPGSLTQSDFVLRLKKLRLPIQQVTAGKQLNIMGSSLTFLYPNQIGDGSNDDSLVLYGKLLNQTFLFTGDLEEEGEKTLIEHYPKLKVDILKAGHHGSKGSSKEVFLDHIQPKLALISAGKNNRYQHPHTETLERFAERRITVYRTDKEGAIRFRGWQNWQIETVRQKTDDFERHLKVLLP